MNKVYIPGDLIYYHGEVTVIKGIDAYGNYLVEYDHYVRDVVCECLKPISLTLEILKKNGWTQTKHRVDEDNFEWYVYENPKVEEIVFQYYPGSKINMFSIFYYGDTEMLQINYVHELQHLLFGLGIDYKIGI